MFPRVIILCIIMKLSCQPVMGMNRKTACPPPWLGYDNYCYLYVMETKTFHEAETHCLSLSTSWKSAHLASVESHKENDFMLDYANAVNKGEYFWIGYNDEQSEDHFTWTDGSSTVFTRWYSGEPNNDGTGQNCVIYYRSGKWNDRGCSALYRFMCKMKGVKLFCPTKE